MPTEREARNDRTLHLVITDSGLGGMAICAEVERNLRRNGPPQDVRITYFNAWPQPNSGYNAMPDEATRARVFDRALVRMNQYQPDRIIIACNTLSVLYPLTDFSRTEKTPVLGIIDAGVDLFFEALTADASAGILLLGTRTTIESKIHRDRLMQKGIAKERIAAAACHGLAAAIDQDPGSSAVEDMIRQCVLNASEEVRPGGSRLYAGLCCTHYSLVAERLRSAIQLRLGCEVRILDPKDSLANRIADSGERAEWHRPGNTIEVTVVSKVILNEHQRRAMAKQLAPVSEAAAEALLSYTHVADLF
jgi:glutamate racemase